MANYYHEARAHVRSLKTLETDTKRRAERRAEVAYAHAEHPLNLLVIDGRQVKLYKNSELHAAAERGEGLITWAVHPDATIDRFDGRALLDMYRDYDADTAPKKPKTLEEERLTKLLTFESFRDLVRLTSRGLSEREGLAAASAENIEIRAAAKAMAVSMYAAGSQPQPLPCTTSAAAAGQGSYAAVGFSYGSSAAGHGAASSSSSDDEDEDGDEDAEAGGPGADGDGVGGEEAAAERQDDLAFQRFGIEDFSYRLHKALEQEGEQADLMGRRPRRRHGRKKARERARRMAGQGLNVKDWRDPVNASSVAAGGGGVTGGQRNGGRAAGAGPAVRVRSESRSRSRSRSPGAAAGGEARGAVFSLLPHAGQGRSNTGQLRGLMREAFERDDDFMEALPHASDPTRLSSNQPRVGDAAAVSLQGVKKVERSEKQERRGGRQGSRSRSRERERSYRGRSRSRSRSRSRHRHRRDTRSRSRSRRRERSRSRSRGRRYGSRSRSREGGGARGRDRGRGDEQGVGGGGSGRQPTGGSNGAGAPAAAARAEPSAGTSAAPAPKAETPQERLKRIIGAQLTKQSQKDLTVSHLKKIQVEKEKHARATLDKAVQPRHRSPSPRRG